MQLKQKTDYAIRFLVYLASNKGFQNAPEMCDILDISDTYGPIVMRALIRKGWVTSRHGTNGGYALVCSPKTISVWDVMEVMEDTVGFDFSPGYANDLKTITTEYPSPMAKGYEIFKTLAKAYFSAVTIEDLTKPQSLEPFYESAEGIMREHTNTKKH